MFFAGTVLYVGIFCVDIAREWTSVMKKKICFCAKSPLWKTPSQQEDARQGDKEGSQGSRKDN
jgi:hypothetical protein